MGNALATAGRDLGVVDHLPADRHPALVYLAGLAPSSRRVQQQALDRLAGILTGTEDCTAVAWHQVRYQHAQALRSRLAESYRPATANRMLCALRGVLCEAWRLGWTTAEEYHRARDLAPVRGSTLPAGRVLTGGEVAALFAACADDDSPAGVRDAAMLGVMLGAGLRREELVQIDVADLDPDTGELRVQGKGSKEREVYATNGSADALRDWLDIRGTEPGALFVPVNRGGRLGTGRITAQAVYGMLRKRAAQAGVKSFSPHDCRRTFCTALLDAGADVASVAGLMGHASTDTTRRYDRRDARVRRHAAEMLHVPYRRRAPV